MPETTKVTHTTRDEYNLRVNGADPNGNGFNWGKVKKIHEIEGEFAIVEYERTPSNLVARAEMVYSLYLRNPLETLDEPDGGWYDTSRGFPTLHAAILGGVVGRRVWAAEGMNPALNSFDLVGFILGGLDSAVKV